MDAKEIMRSADLTNGGVLRDVYVSPEVAVELRAAGYRVYGRDVYVPRFVPERPIVDPRKPGPDFSPDADFDWEGAILARQYTPW